MAKFRRNHSQNDNGMLYRAGVFALIIGILYWGFSSLGEGESSFVDQMRDMLETQDETTATDGSFTPSEFYLPTSNTGQIVEHEFYTLSYDEDHEQAEWVAYEVNLKRLNGKKVKRTDDFRPDPRVKTRSATPDDYRRSGYTRGHLAPAGDMNFHPDAMSESFYMSNMSPQVYHFNGGVWRELEEQVRDWGRKYKQLYVVTGPVLSEPVLETIGRNKVSVPASYYKVLLDLTEPEFKGIGFIIPHELSNEHLSRYAVTIDEVEAVTGIDFFPDLLSEELETELEGSTDVRRWKFNEKRFRQRVEEWNKR